MPLMESAKLNKSFKSVIIRNTAFIYGHTKKINFTQLGAYGNRCEQCYRQTFTKSLTGYL